MSKKKVMKKLIIVAVPILLLGGGFMFYKNKTASAAMQLEMQNMNAQKDTVIRGDIEETISSSGKIQSASLKDVKINKDGTIEEVFVGDGMKIEKGGRLIKLNNVEGSSNLSSREFDIVQLRDEIRKKKEKQGELVIRAPFNGIVEEIKVENGDEIGSGAEVLTLVDKSKMSVTVKYGKLFADRIKVGDKVDAVLLGNLSHAEGVITEVSKSGNGNENGQVLFDVEVEFTNRGALVEGQEVQVHVIKGAERLKSTKNGKTEWANREVLTSELGGDVKVVKVNNSDPVKKGDVLAIIENENYVDGISMDERRLASLQESYKQDKKAYDNTIYAPITGTVIDLNVVSGENIESGNTIAKIADLENFQVKIPIDELDILNVKDGQKAEIKIKAIEKSFTGTVSKVFKVGTDVGGATKYDVVIDIDKNDELKNIRIGMNATINLNLASKTDTLLVPINYVEIIGDDYIVKTEDENGEVKEVVVKVGLMSSKYVEILGDDIKEGDVIVR